MRIGLAVSLFFVVAALPVTAHEGPHDCSQGVPGGLSHLNLVVEDLQPGENWTKTLTYGPGGCPLGDDWWIFVWAQSDGPLRFDMEHEGEALAGWSVDGRHIEHMQLWTAGYPVLRIVNDGDEAVRVQFYFDQTCECPSKATFVNGPVWLNTPAKRGDLVTFDLRVAPFWPRLGDAPALPDGIQVQFTHARPTSAGPEALTTQVLAFSPADSQDCDPQFEGEACVRFSLTARNDGMQYVWVDVLEGAGDGWMVMVVPTISVEKESPAAWWLLPLSLVAVARQTLSRRRRPAP